MSSDFYIPAVPARLIAAERALAAGLILPLTMAFAPGMVFLALVALGHAHYALGYLYRARARPFTPRGLAIYALGLAASFAAAYAAPQAFPVAVGTIFIFHSALDDVYLSGKQPGSLHLTALLILTVVFADLLLQRYAFENLIHPGLLPLLPALFAPVIVLACKRQTMDASLAWFFLITTALCSLQSVSSFPAEYGFGFLILTHYANWYVKVGYRKWRASAAAWRRYLAETLTVNALFAAGLLFYLTHREAWPLYHFVYGEKAFFSWTLMHILSTVRASDIAAFQKALAAK